MSPSRYDESQHRRSGDGRFTTKPPAAAARSLRDDVLAATAEDPDGDGPDLSVTAGHAADTIGMRTDLRVTTDGRRDGFTVRPAAGGEPVLATVLPGGAVGLRLPDGRLLSTGDDEDAARVCAAVFSGTAPPDRGSFQGAVTAGPVGDWYGTVDLDDMEDRARSRAVTVSAALGVLVTNDGRRDGFLVSHLERPGFVSCTVLPDGRVHSRFPGHDHDGYVFDAADTGRAVRSWAAGRQPGEGTVELPAPPPR